MNRYIIIAIRAEDNAVFPAAVKGMSVSGARTAFLAAQEKLCKILSITQIPDKGVLKISESKGQGK